MCQNQTKVNFISYYYDILNVFVDTKILHLVKKKHM